jgi:hypothetical protein
MVGDVGLAVSLMELAREGSVQEASYFPFAGEELWESVEQPIVVIAQCRALRFAGTAVGKGSIQIIRVMRRGWTCNHECNSR